MSLQAYEGGCQCGAVRFAANADLSSTVTCNCSRCGRLGSILAFTPESEFTLKSGEDSLTEYLFNKHVIHHFFCKVCGIQPFSRANRPDGAKMVALNIRCLDDIDPDTFTPTKFDGKSR